MGLGRKALAGPESQLARLTKGSSERTAVGGSVSGCWSPHGPPLPTQAAAPAMTVVSPPETTSSSPPSAGRTRRFAESSSER